MQLIDIILSLNEETAAEEAKRIGLSYMGFGRWGKDDKVTHITQDGKLQTVKVKNKKKQSKTQVGNKTLEKDKKSKKSDNSNQSTQLPTRVASRLKSKLPDTPTVSEVAQEAATSLGRTRPIEVRNFTFMERLKNLFIKLGQGESPPAFYNPKTDVIAMTDSTRTFPKNPSLWETDDVSDFTMMVHEATHAASPRVRNPSYFNDPVAQMLEEGLTESIARRSTTQYRQQKSNNSELTTNYQYTNYDTYVRAIDTVVERSNGRITHDSLMKTKSPEELKKLVLPEMRRILIEDLQASGFNDIQIKRLEKVTQRSRVDMELILMDSDYDILTSKTSTPLNLKERLKQIGFDDSDVDFIVDGK